jgi:hypothetical protein
MWKFTGLMFSKVCYGSIGLKISTDGQLTVKSPMLNLKTTVGCGYEVFCLLETRPRKSVERQLTVRKNISLPSSGLKSKPSKKPVRSRALLPWFTFKPRRWRRYVPRKLRLAFNGLHGFTISELVYINCPMIHGLILRQRRTDITSTNMSHFHFGKNA